MPKLIEDIASLLKVTGSGVILVESTTICGAYPLSFPLGAQVSADLIIAVSVFNDPASQTIALSQYCALSRDNKRPIIGRIDFNLALI